jgi:hypothetical protein
VPPYTAVNIGQSVQVCSAGAPNEYNKESNVRYLRLQGDASGTSHTVTVTGVSAGTVPLLNRRGFTAGSSTFSTSGTVPAQGIVLSVGDCTVAMSLFSTVTAACTEPATPPAEQCWTVNYQ